MSVVEVTLTVIGSFYVLYWVVMMICLIIVATRWK